MYSTYKEPHGNKRFFEGVIIAVAIMGGVFLVAFASFVSWSEWGANGPSSHWTDIPMTLLCFYGVTQWVFIVPVYLFYKKRNFKYTAKGLLAAAGLISLLNGLIYLFIIA